MPPRLAIADLPALTRADLPAGVACYQAGPPPSVRAELTVAELLFVDAWLARRAPGPAKQRPGDGASWDAPGFTPPG
jgi:hypothetical protein